MMSVFTRRTLRQSSHIALTSPSLIWTTGYSSFHSQPCASRLYPATRRRQSNALSNRKYSQDHSAGLPMPTGGIVTSENQLGLPQAQQTREKSPARKRKGGMAGLRDLTRNSASKNAGMGTSEDPLASSRRILGQDSSRPIRARFAPSPTGDLHLGSLRTALFNKLAATATNGGQFILRIEDTDQRRKVEGAEERVMKDLKWAGLDWQEGPDIGGPFGPYRQSERLSIYKDHVDKLLDKGHAYRCFCSTKQLEETKLAQHTAGQATVYPGTCRSVSKNEGEERAAKGEAHVVRFKADDFPRPGFVDQIYGRFKKNEDEDDFILIKQDGYPTYHLANVVDDHLMQITHVIRGEEWLISTPKHIALYQAFGWEPPQFAHLGLLTNKDGTKLSKRHSANNIHDIGSPLTLLPVPFNTWLATLGSSIDEKKAMPRSIQELSDRLTFKFTRGGIRVDHAKRTHFEQKYWMRLRAVIDVQLQSGQPVKDATPAREIDPTQRRIPEIAQAPPEDALSNYERSILENSIYRSLLRFLAHLESQPLPESGLDNIQDRDPSPLWADWIDPASCLEQDYDKLPSHVTAHLDHFFRSRPPLGTVADWFSDNKYVFFRPSDIKYRQGLDSLVAGLLARQGQRMDVMTEIHEHLHSLRKTVQSHDDTRVPEVAGSSSPAVFYNAARLVVRGHGTKSTPSLGNCIDILGKEEMYWRIERVQNLLRAGEETLGLDKAPEGEDGQSKR